MIPKDSKTADLFKRFYNLDTKKKRLAFWQTIEPPEKYTNAQRMYAAIYDEALRKETLNGYFDPFHKDIDLYFPEQIAQEFRSILEQQRRQKEQEILKKKPSLLYHVSKSAPKDITGNVFQPRQQYEQFRDRGMVCAVFAQPTPRISFHIRSGQAQKAFLELPHLDGKRAIIIIDDQQKFMNYNKHNPYSYEYTFSSDLFVPNIGYDGRYHGEWLAFSPVAYKSYKKFDLEKALQTCQKQFKKVDLCFARNAEDFVQLVQDIRCSKTSVEEFISAGKLIPYQQTKVQKSLTLKKTLVNGIPPISTLHKNPLKKI